MNSSVRQPPAFVPTLTEVVVHRVAASLVSDVSSQDAAVAPGGVSAVSVDAMDHLAEALAERVIAVVRQRLHEAVVQELDNWALRHAADWSEQMVGTLHEDIARECRSAAAALSGLGGRVSTEG